MSPDSKPEKDIVIIVGGGGMAAIFAAGVLEVFGAKLRERVRAVYATSAGAEMGVYFVSGQAHIPPRFTLKYLTQPEFIPGNLLRYLYKVFIQGGKDSKIPDYIDIEYFIPTAQGSEDCVLDLDAVEDSEIGFFVRVVDIDRVQASYLPANNKDDLPQRLMATSQCGPFSTKTEVIEGRRYIDGGTISSNIEVELAVQNPDTQFLYIESAPPNFTSRALLYPMYVIAGLAIMRLYGRAVGTRYLKELFLDPNRELFALENVTVIRNTLGTSTFCQDKEQLRAAYEHGKAKAERILAEL